MRAIDRVFGRAAAASKVCCRVRSTFGSDLSPTEAAELKVKIGPFSGDLLHTALYPSLRAAHSEKRVGCGEPQPQIK